MAIMTPTPSMHRAISASQAFASGSTMAGSSGGGTNSSIHAGNDAAATAAALSSLGLGGIWPPEGGAGGSTPTSASLASPFPAAPVAFVSGSQLSNTSAPAPAETSPMPPTALAGSPGAEPLAAAGPSAVSGGGAHNPVPPATAKSNPFLNKLRNMVDDPATDDMIRWSSSGESFVVPNHVRFGDEVLPRFFKHNRFSSFVRQLNMYGFHKVPHLQQGALKHDVPGEAELWEFKNDFFQKDHPELMAFMQRKRGSRNDDREGDEKPKAKSEDGKPEPLDAVNGALMRNADFEGQNAVLQLNNVWTAIKAIQAAQQNINDNLRHLHTTNADLWREALESRQRSKKQEETINKMLRFLAGVFGAQDIGLEQGATGAARGERASSASSSGSGSGRRVVVRTPRKGVLMIGGPEGAKSHEGGDDDENGAHIFEELEVPMDDGSIEELPSTHRFSDINSASNSPQNASTPKGRFTNLPGSPSVSESTNRAADATPRADPRHSGGQIEASQGENHSLDGFGAGSSADLVMSLLSGSAPAQGNSTAAQSGQTGTAAGASSNSNAKLDPNTLAALHGILAQALSGGDAISGQSHSGGTLDKSAAGIRPSSSMWPSSGQSASPASSKALVQSPLPRRTSAYTNSTPTPPTGHQHRQHGSPPRNQLVANPLQRASQNLAGASTDATTVQNALNALVESLRLDPSHLDPDALQSLQQAASQASPSPNGTTGLTPTDAAMAAANARGGFAYDGTAPQPEKGPSTSDGTGMASSSDFDMETPLSQFLDPGAVGGMSHSAPTPGFDAASPSGGGAGSGGGGMNATEPVFAFSPTTSATAFRAATAGAAGAAAGAGGVADHASTSSEPSSSTATTSPSGNSPATTASGSGAETGQASTTTTTTTTTTLASGGADTAARLRRKRRKTSDPDDAMEDGSS